MQAEIILEARDAQGRTFLTWRPTKGQLRLIDVPAGSGDVPVRLSSQSVAGGGAVVFADHLTHQGTDTLDLVLPADGSPVEFWAGGKPQAPSSEFGDVSIAVHEIAGAAGGVPLALLPTMVRIRKNANNLTTGERNRFLSAFAALNGQGAGIFSQFRTTHGSDEADDQAHAGAGFLPWHRAFLLDLERELQAIDATVTLPYWRFDEAAPNLIHRDFIGVPKTDGTVGFNLGNPLRTWATDGQPGVFRGIGVTPTGIPQPRIPGFVVLTELQTLALSAGPTARFTTFARMQGTPHGAAHMANWTGPITEIPNAARDPLFFLLHCNVDRLWAKWQWVNRRHDPAMSSAFGGPPNIKGHNLADSLWPWDQDTAFPRPNFAPRAGLAAGTMTAAPGPQPHLRDMIDYHGAFGGHGLGFAYDDVWFEL